MNKTKEKILQAAIQYFGVISYDKVSIEDITKGANVNVSAISYYFGGKEKLYHEVINALNRLVIEKLSQLDPKQMVEMNIDDAKNYLQTILNVFHDLFTSIEGQSRVNIFLRELTCSAEGETKNLFNRHVEFSYRFLHEALTIYYIDKLKLPTTIISFKITVFFSILKELATNAQKPIKMRAIYDNTYNDLISFMLDINKT